MATDVAQFHNETVNLIYKIASVALNFIVVACVTWYNNDYTPVACEWTGGMRQQKAINRGEDMDIPAEAMEEVGYLEDGDDDE
jgi:hypothetical protein